MAVGCGFAEQNFTPTEIMLFYHNILSKENLPDVLRHVSSRKNDYTRYVISVKNAD